ncbi:MAG: DMT family transporter [Sporolactobacillus sp.]
MTMKHADYLLVLVTALWGSSYLMMKTGLANLGVFNLISLRFLLAFCLLAPFFYRRLRHTTRKTVIHAFILSLNLIAVFATIMFGLQHDSASKAGFINALTAVFVPLLDFLCFRCKPERKVVLAIFTAFCGVALLTCEGGFIPGTGDLFCIAGAVFNALYLLLVDRFSKQEDGVALSVWQMGLTGVFSLLLSLSVEPFKLPVSSAGWMAVLGLGVLCSAVGYTLQNVAQRYTVSSHAGLIFMLEPVFSALFAYVLIGETLSAQGYAGAALVMLSIVLLEIRLPRSIRYAARSALSTMHHR